VIGPNAEKGEIMVNHASSVARTSVWILVAVVAALVLLAAALLVASQSGLLHTLGTALQGPAHMAEYCTGSQGICP
jgi:hypothetical protein